MAFVYQGDSDLEAKAKKGELPYRFSRKENITTTVYNECLIALYGLHILFQINTKETFELTQKYFNNRQFISS